MTKTTPTALDLLRILYQQYGPIGMGGRVLPPKIYATYSDAKIDKFYEFLDRRLMRDVAKVLAKAGRWKDED